MSFETYEQLVNKSKKYFDEQNYKEAEAILSNIIEMGPEQVEAKYLVEAYFIMANIFHTQGMLGKAIKAFNKVIELQPDHTDAAISLSVLYNDIGKYEEAKTIFDQANVRVKNKAFNDDGLQDKHINRKFSLKHIELGDLYLSYNRFDEALFEYNKGVRLNPENLEARIKTAKVYAKKGFMAKAFDELKKLKNEYPEYTDARVALGVLFYGSGNIIEAQNEWERALTKDPSNEQAALYMNLSKAATETNLSF